MLLKLETRKETRKQPASQSKYVGLGTAMAAEIMIGFWFGIGVILAVWILDSMDHCVEVFMSSK